MLLAKESIRGCTSVASLDDVVVKHTQHAKLSRFDDEAIRWLLEMSLAAYGIGLANGERPNDFPRARSKPALDRKRIESR